jgi:hypothetical protein
MSSTEGRDAALDLAKIVQILRDANEPVLCQQGREDEVFGVPQARTHLEQLATQEIPTITIAPAWDDESRYTCIELVV